MTRALVLAAGRGERLRPLTDGVPKPLLPVLGVSIVERTLRRLADAGIEATAVNLHHLGDRIAAALGDDVDGMPLTYSPEEVLLGTLGPLARLRGFLAGTDPVVLVNGDSLCDWPVERVLEAHRSGAAVATLLVASSPDPDEFGGGVSVDAGGRVLSFRGASPPGTARRGVFAGLHAVSAAILENVDERPSDIVRDLYEPLLASGAIVGTVFTKGRWHDLGTPRRYLEGVLDAAAESGGEWIDAAASVSPTAVVRRSVLEAGSAVDEAARVDGSVLLEGARVGAEARVRDSVVGPGAHLAAGARLDGSLVTVSGSGVVATRSL